MRLLESETVNGSGHALLRTGLQQQGQQNRQAEGQDSQEHFAVDGDTAMCAGRRTQQLPNWL